MKEQRQFTGLWIPAHILEDPDLSFIESAFFAEITSFCSNGKVFYKTNETIASTYGISRPTIQKALKKYTDKGWIVQTFNGRRREITLHPDLDLTRSMQNEDRQREKLDQAACKNSTAITKKKVQKTTQQKVEVVYPFNSVLFMDAWNEFLAMRKAQHNFTYKHTKSKQAALHKLHKQAGGDERIAVLILEQATTNCWRGTWPLKDEQQQRPNPVSDGSIIAAHLRGLASQSS